MPLRIDQPQLDRRPLVLPDADAVVVAVGVGDRGVGDVGELVRELAGEAEDGQVRPCRGRRPPSRAASRGRARRGSRPARRRRTGAPRRSRARRPARSLDSAISDGRAGGRQPRASASRSRAPGDGRRPSTRGGPQPSTGRSSGRRPTSAARGRRGSGTSRPTRPVRSLAIHPCVRMRLTVLERRSRV